MINKAQITLLTIATLVSTAWADSIDITPTQIPADVESKEFTNIRAEFVGQTDIMAKSKPDIFTQNTKDIFSEHKPDTLSVNKKDIFSNSKPDVFEQSKSDVFEQSKSDVFTKK